ncbi:uncharacterized protein OCT59_008114 [Rhizophagus irregularis]|uniref:Uncharacterized protein n=2 Tax=Rhizophagus irregularis (strain DAOM 181602 / DAOM 197198 / MUCL 43194) TaxID=747089 RepID=A0A2P4PQ23_RHIID|nr:hypothetical protein GLOIN_2v1779349 [Rhizophagus irregularis DAOM 181602=DAOM 197198]UZO16734.1 hypothetical protein OCT59_008114 [Rhizophagus irregularis]POG67494.1 hypothetical protein GLOIN_2v1779349 [Rhizophagus irregularis DAOM 181602=DAOM 197198]CAB4377563.1 unnamed protein product [Rhizophagus irregularis]CAB5375382.1 unnamed protein product [Rhizophagus irregularis]GBC42805.2 hypothetical protein GLOIN_2v1779349 [Rhizophagus irregularis DAOM 181602=DAOM 197198]|eukprot:XP_025174360.1 hypothetical protein GLOIN_2v1779349 [Rhizophagus irregularis DAOM 181602=DAOM 197198]
MSPSCSSPTNSLHETFTKLNKRTFEKSYLPSTQVFSSTSSNELPIEVFEKIFNNFNSKGKEYILTLHSCLLVSKDWSLSIMKLLYSNPFYYFKEIKDINKIIDTLLLCLNKSELDMLFEHGIINSNYKNNNNNTITPYYNYPKYLKNLYYRGFLSIIHSWIITRNINSNSDNYNILSTTTTSTQFEIIVRVLLNLFFRESKQLEKLHICSTNLVWDKKELSCMYLLMSNSLGITSSGGLKSGLCTNLDSIYLTVDCPMNNFLPLLSKQCRNLTNLGVMMDLHRKSCYTHSPPPTDISDIKNICTLISSQRNLQSFQIMFSSNTSLLISALYTQRETLRSLDFYWVDFRDCTSLIELTHFKQLEVVKFRNCFNLKKEICEPLLNNDWENLCHVVVINTECFTLREWARKINIKMCNNGYNSDESDNGKKSRSNSLDKNISSKILNNGNLPIISKQFKRNFQIEE